MADTKISALTSGNPAQSGDEIPIARSGANYKITAGSIAALASSTPGGTSGDIQYNNAGAFGGITPGTGVSTALTQNVTGSGGFVLATSPTLTTPNLGTPTALTLTNATGLPLSTGVTGTLPVASGGTGTTTPSLVAGTNVTITGSWPNQTINAAAGSSGVVVNTTTITGGTSGRVLYDNAGTVGEKTVTGSGDVVLATSPALTTPDLGTPSAATLTNATGLPVSTGISGLGTNVATALAVNVGSSGAFVANGGALGTPSSGTLTNATGLPIGTGVSGLGTGVATFLATPSSANLAAAVTDETGSGLLVFATSPTLTTPNLGTPSALTLTNATGLPVGGISATGTPSSTTYLRGDGSWQTVSGGSGDITIGTTVINSGTSGRILYDNSGVVGEKAVTGSGDVVLATSPTLVTPALGTPTALTLTNATGLPVGGISATGTPSSTTYLRGDGTWSTVSGGGGSPGGSSGQLQYNNAGAFGGTSGITTTGTELTIASGTKTASTPVLDITQTWNNAAVTFTGLKFNVTNTASNSVSLLMDLQVGGTSQFKVRRDGAVNASAIQTTNGNGGIYENGTTLDGVSVRASGFNVNLGSSSALRWFVGTDPSGSTADTILVRDGAANTLALRNGTNAQTLSVYGTYTDASNYERTTISSATYSGGLYQRVRAETAGTGGDNIGLVLSPTGTGAFMLSMPDGATSGGNARGQYAVDLQLYRGAAAGLGSRVASGDGSFAAGRGATASGTDSIAIGTGTIASGQTAVVFGGGTASASGSFVVGGGTASGPGSVCLGSALQATFQGSVAIGENCSSTNFSATAMGNSARADKLGQFAFGLFRFANAGDAQWSVLGMWRQTSDATPVELWARGNTNSRAVLPASTTWMADINLIARSSGGTDNACFKRRCIIKRDASNNTALVGSVQTIDTDIGSNSGSPPTGWAVTVTADDTNEALKIEVTGAAATNIRWVAKVDLVEVGY